MSAGLGVFTPEQIAASDGLTLMKKVISGEIAQSPYYRFLGANLEAVGPGRATVRAFPRPEYQNPLGTVHGGYIATLLDMCMGCAAHTRLAESTIYVTVDLNLNFIRPVSYDLGELSALGNVIHLGRTIGVIEGKLMSAAGKLLATGRSTVALVKRNRDVPLRTG